MIMLSVLALLFSAFPAILYFRNVLLFRPPPVPSAMIVPISVLIPARNEEGAIAACVHSVLASNYVDLECIVLDDHSTDATAEIVDAIAAKDARVRLEKSPPLPAGWSGKQHACYTLSQLAKQPTLVFLDADVRLQPDCLARLAAFQKQSNAPLVSGFPKQETETFLEKLLIPLIHFMLLGFLPFSQMRKQCLPGLGAGCGQLFLTTKEAYEKVGGHSNMLVRDSFHDGIKLPRAYRTNGLMTDLCDVTELATCRMYRTAGQVWNGLAKNAGEGLAAPKLIVFSTLMLLIGQVIPVVLFIYGMRGRLLGDEYPGWMLIAGLALLASYYPRLNAVTRFRQSHYGAMLHPLGVLLLLAIQWYATIRALIGRPVGWKGRTR
jgi:glycosyltransferase involved in cell wall biosynthesis